jgi:hypothetical protein
MNEFNKANDAYLERVKNKNKYINEWEAKNVENLGFSDDIKKMERVN